MTLVGVLLWLVGKGWNLPVAFMADQCVLKGGLANSSIRSGRRVRVGTAGLPRPKVIAGLMVVVKRLGRPAASMAGHPVNSGPRRRGFTAALPRQPEVRGPETLGRRALAGRLRLGT
ncbi:hypothetical protein ACQP2X_47825 [Actinoplanes sp. CA-131856]